MARLGPVFELIVDGRYLWAPQARIRSIECVAPRAVHDLLWAPASFKWVNGGEAVGFIPVRYPSTEKCEEDALRLAKRTEWLEPSCRGGACRGLGQRVFFTGVVGGGEGGEVSILDLRRLEFDPLPGT